LKALAASIAKLTNRKAMLFECSDGRHLVRIEPLSGDEKAFSEWLCGDDYLEWLRCMNDSKMHVKLKVQ
jgi:hypothetical protein